MALSVQKLRGAAVTSLGYVNVPTPGTPVALSVNIDANNSNAPGTAFPPSAAGPAGTQTEYSPSFRGYTIWGYKPGAANNGMIVNTGNVYLLTAPAANGSGNRTDSGSIIAIIAAGNRYDFFPDGTGRSALTPYSLFLDSDNANDGGLVTAYGGSY